MDAKSRADFINSVGSATGDEVQKICPQCGLTGKGKFCKKCGTALIEAPVEPQVDSSPVAPPVEQPVSQQAPQPVSQPQPFPAATPATPVNTAGEKVCPNCGATGTGKFCKKCGSPLVEATGNVPPIQEQVHKESRQAASYHGNGKTPFKILERRPALQNENKKGVFNSFMDIEDYQEEASVFADGMPDWSLEPPNIAVRRRGSKL